MSEIIQRLYDNRGLTLRERCTVLEQEAPHAAVLVADSRRLNWLERPIVLALAIGDDEDWENGATAVDLAELFKQRTADVAKELFWLHEKKLIKNNVNDDGDELWTLAPGVLAGEQVGQ